MSHPFVQTRKIRNIVLFLHKWPRVDERPQRLKEGRARPPVLLSGRKRDGASSA